MAHWSSCSQHNAPALPIGTCDCGDDAPMSAKPIENPDYGKIRAAVVKRFAKTLAYLAKH